MSVELLERTDRSNVAPPRARAAVTARFTSVAQRFPSVSRGLFSIFDQAIVSGAAFLTAALIGRTTSPDQLGLYYLVLSIVLIVSGIQDQLVASPYVIYSKRRRGRELEEYVGSIWMHYLVLTLLTIAGLVVAIILCAATGETSILPGLWALLFAGPVLVLRESIRRFNFANLHVKSAIVLDLIVAIAQLGGLFLIVYVGRLSLFSIYAVMGAACGMACAVWYGVDRPRARFVRARFMPDWRHNWSFGRWALRSFLVGNTTAPAMLWILNLAVGTSATGVLGACVTIIGVTNVILSGVSNVLTPQAAHGFQSGGASELRRILVRTAAFFVLTLGGFAVFVLLSGDWLAVLVFGPAYQGTGLVLFALALGALMNSLGMVAGNGLWAIDRPRYNFVADVCCMCVTLVAAAFLIFPLGTLGAALATTAGSTTAAIVRTVTLVRQLEGPALVTGVATDSALSS